ncbi:MAG: helix-turn-helix domain-containing protein [Deltaproteobacteria bacterium]|nr:helix-turn-helix domain-containing protein [Deltaproteobacteria bacterium]
MARKRSLYNRKCGKKSQLERKALVKKLKRFMRKYKDYRFTILVQIIILAKKGKSVSEVAVILHVLEVTVRRWIRRFNEEGYHGLLDKPRSGRPKKASDDMLFIILSSKPVTFGIEMGFWTALD